MKKILYIQAIILSVLISSCGTTKFTADYDDLYYTAKKDKNKTNTNYQTNSDDNAISSTTKSGYSESNNTVVMNPYYREDNSNNGFNDIGFGLARKIVDLFPQLESSIIEPTNKIRATVIGAGAYSLSISGSTSFLDQELDFPIRNLPVIRVDIDRNKLSIEHVKEEINKSFTRFDLTEGEDVVALYFKDPVRASYNRLKLFAQAIEESLPNSIINEIGIVFK